MARFNIERNGYKASQVDEFIDALILKYENKLSEQNNRLLALRNENNVLESNLNDLKLKEDEISRALLFAVEKAEQVEKSAQKIYELEVRRIRLIYTRWNEIIGMLDQNMLSGIVNGKFGFAMQEFQNDLERIIEQNDNYESRKREELPIKEDLKQNSGNYIKNLLNRMDYLVTTPVKDEKSTKVKMPQKVQQELSEQHKKENARLLSINRRFNDITGKLGIPSGVAILDDEISKDNAYYKNITNENGPDEDAFDLDAVLTPKEDLDEIMKAFEDL
ncbi:MAG: DivIVA domain-containing protein [Clostridia bacterium]|nr:DivIVA domain-containing protein [Clostridia bacterium]